MSLLEVSKLSVRFDRADAPALQDFNLTIEKGESVGLVGESGSGKTQAALAIMGLSNSSSRVAGSVRFDGQELLGGSASAWRKIRARRIAMVFQDPKAALNPYLRIGDQLGMVLAAHGLARGAEQKKRVLDMLELTGLPDPERQSRAYPHQLSGGMRQRAMIASALIAEPELLIADEPTTAIDATIQAQILTLLRELRSRTGVALLLISHDLGIVAGNSDRLVVLHDGQTIESGDTPGVFANPEHQQTKVMINAAHHPESLAPDMQSEQRSPLLELEDLSVSYFERRRDRLWGRQELVAVQPLNLSLRPGETLAVVGESGSGKTSLARAVLGLLPPRGGVVSYLGNSLAPELKQRRIAELRQLQMVFQDPLASLDPAMRIERCIEEPISLHQPALDAAQRAAAVADVLQRVGLDDTVLRRFPHQLSGGQAQRVAIARALVLRPRVLICDEAVASLDGQVRRGILRLLADEQRRSALSIIFISHDLNVVRQLSHRVMVMYMGHVFESAGKDAIFARPGHPYSRALIDSMPSLDPGAAPAVASVEGEIASLLAPPSGCVFHPRCPYRETRCEQETPPLRRIGDSDVACHRAEEIDLAIPGRRAV